MLQDNKESRSYAAAQQPQKKKEHTHTHTWSTVILLHPDVTVALGNTCLRVQEGETHGALGAQAGIVAAAVFNGFFIKLLTKAATERMGGGGETRVQCGVQSYVDRVGRCLSLVSHS